MQDKTIDYVLRTTWQSVVKMYNEQAAKFNTTMATGFALLSIDVDKGIPSTALGPRMGMEATSLSRTLKTMEDRGLIVRKPNPSDGRGVLIYLTEFGKQKRTISKDVVLKFNNAIRENTSPQELDSFFKVTELINKFIERKKIFNHKEPTIKQ